MVFTIYKLSSIIIGVSLNKWSLKLLHSYKFGTGYDGRCE